MKRDGATDKKIVQILAPAARNADANADLDLAAHNYPQKVTIVFDFGAEGITLSPTDKIEGKVRHGDAPTPTTAVVPADIVVPPGLDPAIASAPDANGKLVTADGNADIPGSFQFGYVGDKRYVNCFLDFAGTHGAATPCSVYAILEGLTNTPQA